VETKGANHHYVYRILDGVMPKGAPPRDAQKGNASSVVMPKAATPVVPISPFRDAQSGNARGAQMGTVSNNKEVITISKGEENPPNSQKLSGTDKQILNDELRRLLVQRKELGSPRQYPDGHPAHEEIVFVKNRIQEVHRLLGIPFFDPKSKAATGRNAGKIESGQDVIADARAM
jgi:hypothetical protein